MNATVLQLSFRSLKERKGIALTMKTESVTTRTEIRIGVKGSFPVRWFATTIEIKMPAAAGIGSPCVYFAGACGWPSSPVEATLKRASRIAPVATNTKPTSMPPVPSSVSDQR